MDGVEPVMGDVPALGQHTDAILEELGVDARHGRRVAHGGSDLMAIKQGWTGRVFEDFTVGDIYEHPLGRTILDADNVWFTCLTMNTNPIHFDGEYAAQTEFKKPLVNSCFTLSLVTGPVGDRPDDERVANLGWDEVRLPHPVFEGDTIYSRSEVLETRESKSRPKVGIVRVKTTGVNQDATPVIEFTRTFMVWKRGTCRADSVGQPAT